MREGGDKFRRGFGGGRGGHRGGRGGDRGGRGGREGGAGNYSKNKKTSHDSLNEEILKF